MVLSPVQATFLPAALRSAASWPINWSSCSSAELFLDAGLSARICQAGELRDGMSSAWLQLLPSLTNSEVEFLGLGTETLVVEGAKAFGSTGCSC